jgi:tetratricopeptide (TPR) repeat protein
MQSKDFKQLMREAVALQESGRYQEAIVLFDELISFDPRRESAYNSKGLTWKLAGNPDRAIECYEQALDVLFGKIFWSLKNDPGNHIYPWKKIPGDTWISWITKTAIHTSCYEHSISAIGWPTDESAAEELRTMKHRGLLWVDTSEELGIMRIFLPNFFHTMRELLIESKVFSRILNNIGMALLSKGHSIEAGKKLYESIAFIPDGDSYDDPYIALYHVHNNN